MSELDTSLHELREDLRSTISKPDLSRVAGRARARSVRRRMQIGAIAAVVAVSVSVPVLRSLPGSTPPAGPPDDRRVNYQVDFADPTRGYALRSKCEDPDGPCSFALLATVDGGANWQTRTLPVENGHYSTSELEVLGPHTLAIARVPIVNEETYEPFVSVDGGRTWRAYSELTLVAPSTSPAGAKLQQTCAGSTGSECATGLAVLSPEKGTMSLTPTQPAIVEAQSGEVATAGGRFWAVGQVPGSQNWAVSVTSDAGATWTTTPLDVPGKLAMSDAWSVVEHDTAMYVTVIGSIGIGPVELLAVFQSTNAGVSWTRTWVAEGDQRLQAVLGDAVATADGRLLVYSTTRGTFESSDGRTFTKASRQLPGPVTWTRGGYVAQVDEGTYEISRDGLTWRRFEVR